MENFLTWEVLETYASFVSIVYMVVEFTKEIKFIKKIPTRIWSFLVAFLLLIILNLVIKNFKLVDLVLYALTAISISLGSNGLSDFNKKEKKE